jgi:hypothetical protein
MAYGVLAGVLGVVTATPVLCAAAASAQPPEPDTQVALRALSTQQPGR